MKLTIVCMYDKQYNYNYLIIYNVQKEKTYFRPVNLKQTFSENNAREMGKGLE